METIHAKEELRFDPHEALEKLLESNGQQVIGGDKGVTQLFEVKEGQLRASSDYRDYVQGDHGNGYLESLEKRQNSHRNTIYL